VWICINVYTHTYTHRIGAGVYVHGLTHEFCASEAEINKLMAKGNKSRVRVIVCARVYMNVCVCVRVDV
jgi:hypothetical protein